MKTAREFAEEWSGDGDEGEIVQLMYAVLDRDAEHAAESQAREKALRDELLKLQDDLLAGAQREEALEAGNDRLKGELTEKTKAAGVAICEKGQISLERDRLKGDSEKLAEVLKDTQELNIAQRTEFARLKGELEARIKRQQNEMSRSGKEIYRLKGELGEWEDTARRSRKELTETKGELAEARKELLYVADCERVTPDCHRRILALLNPVIPSPAESTGVQRDVRGILPGGCAAHVQTTDFVPAAPPDDIRERVANLEQGLSAKLAYDRASVDAMESIALRLKALEAARTPERLYSDAIEAALRRESGTATTSPAAPQEQAGPQPSDVCSACRKMFANHVNEICDARQFVPMTGGGK